MLLATCCTWSIDTDSEFQRGYINFKMMSVQERNDVSKKIKSVIVKAQMTLARNMLTGPPLPMLGYCAV